jgi:hypothetical protein
MTLEQDKAEATADACGVAPSSDPVNSCALCGPLKSGDPVYQCTICMQMLCVKHLDARLHQCYTGYL